MKTLYARQLLAAILAVTLVEAHFPGLRAGSAAKLLKQRPPRRPRQSSGRSRLGEAQLYPVAPSFFRNLLAPYSPISIAAPGLTNSPRIDQLIHDGKLELSSKKQWSWRWKTAMDIVVQQL